MEKRRPDLETLTLPLDVRRLAELLLEWYAGSKRSLPWRDNPDPYRVWISEIMLQQTQVKTVVPYFERFVATYPNLHELARADEARVLEHWAGLGYYSRARNLRQAAQMILEKHEGRFPRSFSDAILLPGIGRYSAGAVLSIAYGLPFPALDGNVKRVLARLTGLTDPITGRLERQLWDLLEGIVTVPSVAARISDFNQAWMELGALVCTPRNPSCPECPLQKVCRARQEGLQERIPARRRARASEELHFVVAIIRKSERFLLRQNCDGPFLRGFWEFPRTEAPAPRGESRGLILEFSGLRARLGHRLPKIIHQITFRRLHFHPFLAEIDGTVPAEHFAWVELGASGFPIPAYVRKIAATL